MVELIAQYLSFQKQVSVKDVGTFSVEELPARLDFPNRLLHSPEQILHFNTTWSDDELFEQWLQKESGLSKQEIKDQLQHLSVEFQHTLSAANELVWNGIGRFFRNDQQLILFTPSFETLKRPPLPAEKVIRKHAQHSLLVGEQEKTNVEMQELLQNPLIKTLNFQWLFALALFLASILATLLVYNTKPKQWNRQGNGEQQTIREMPVLYKIQ